MLGRRHLDRALDGIRSSAYRIQPLDHRMQIGMAYVRMLVINEPRVQVLLIVRQPIDLPTRA